ncbi:MAG: 4-(cytidine 5'-diphospho)-2-C-methyl-D-erythritol kinase [Dehalococcoidia bacterium]
MLTLSAHAKINLTFEVLSKRDDGYHDVATILQTIDLSDVISFAPSDELKFLSRDIAGIRGDMLEQSVLKAASLLQDETGCREGALIRMENLRIPRAVGLGSSSTDSAAVLKGLNELWALGLSTDDMIRLAAKLGSDTPFFIRGGTALAEGRGEIITPIPSPAKFWLLVMVPPLPAAVGKTARMYEMLTPSHFTTGNLTNKFVIALLNEPHLRGDMLYNTFEQVAFDFFPNLEKFRQMFFEAVGRKVHLAGAGPALFTLLTDEEQGKILFTDWGNEGMKSYLTYSL